MSPPKSGAPPGERTGGRTQNHYESVGVDKQQDTSTASTKTDNGPGFSFIEQLIARINELGGTIRGGCEYCDAYQTLTRETFIDEDDPDETFSVAVNTTHHDDWCPGLTEYEAHNNRKRAKLNRRAS